MRMWKILVTILILTAGILWLKFHPVNLTPVQLAFLIIAMVFWPIFARKPAKLPPMIKVEDKPVHLRIEKFE